jgi:Transcription termination factor nusG
MVTEWRLLCVRPRFEMTVTRQLERQNIEHYLPTLRRRSAQSTIELPLFPGYLFCKIATGRRMPVSLLPGVLSVWDCEDSDISQDIQSLRHIMMSGLKYGPWSYPETGTVAIAIDGPLRGLNGFVMDGNRFIVPIRSVFRSVMVELEGTTSLVSPDSSYESNSAA